MNRMNRIDRIYPVHPVHPVHPRELLPNAGLGREDPLDRARVVDVTDRRPERVGGVVRLRDLAQVQEETDHLAHLVLLGACLARFHAPLPNGVSVERWDATANVALAVAKYCAGLPWYRSEQLQAFFGVPIPASTQFDRCEHVANCLLPIFLGLEQLTAVGGTFVLDDTTVRILDLMRENKSLPESERRGTWTTGIIARGATHQIALYYSGRRHAGDNFERLLEKRPAAMKPPVGLGDAASRNWPASFQLTIAKCLAHARREFVDLETAFPAECARVLDDLARIYRVDAETSGMSAEARLAHHQLHSGPVFDRLREWIEQEIAERRVEPNGPLFKAYRYLLTHWHGLTQVPRIGSAPIDSNIVERALKKAVLLRKNALFFRSQHGADVGSMILSVTGTTRMAGVPVFDYLVDIVRKAQVVRADPRRWLPWAWAARERAPSSAAA
jgi:transposase